MEMEIRPLTEAERKYTYTQSMQIEGQTGCIGHLRGDFDRDGSGFFTSWNDHRDKWKTDEFKAEMDGVVNALRSEEYGLLKDRPAMGRYAAQYPESRFRGSYCDEYGFRAETEKHAFLIRCNPTQGDYNFYCYCYVKEWLDQHIQKAEKGIRFIDSCYNEKFRILDGEKIAVTTAQGEKREYTCRYIDETHLEMDCGRGTSLYHICQLAELMERNGSECVPVEPEKGQEEKTEGIMELKTRFGTTEHVTLAAGVYAENGGLSVEMVSVEDGFREPYGSVTVNLSVPVPPYCAFVDTNNMPEAVGFLAKNGIARPTGLQRQSGYCVYPLYQFDAEKMRGLCPDRMAAYERENGDGRKAEKRKKGR